MKLYSFGLLLVPFLIKFINETSSRHENYFKKNDSKAKFCLFGISNFKVTLHNFYSNFYSKLFKLNIQRIKMIVIEIKMIKK